MWLHLLFNTIIPFTILFAMNMSIYKKLVLVSSEQYYGVLEKTSILDITSRN